MATTGTARPKVLEYVLGSQIILCDNDLATYTNIMPTELCGVGEQNFQRPRVLRSRRELLAIPRLAVRGEGPFR